MAEVVIFDMDGTLIDTAKGTVTAFRECAPRFGLPQLTDKAIRAAIGWPVPEFFRRLYPGFDDALVLRFGHEAEKKESDILLSLGKSILFPGAEGMLHALQHMGKKLYLASTGQPAHVSACMQATGVAACFADICCGEPSKEAMLARIISRHPGAQAVMIGDTLKDVQAARANRIPVIGAGFGYCDASRASLFDRVAATPKQLVQWLQ